MVYLVPMRTVRYTAQWWKALWYKRCFLREMIWNSDVRATRLYVLYADVAEGVSAVKCVRRGPHSPRSAMTSWSPHISITLAWPGPLTYCKEGGCSRTVKGWEAPPQDSDSRNVLHFPARWVMLSILMLNAAHSIVHIIAAPVTLNPMGRPVIAHVTAVMLSTQRLIDCFCLPIPHSLTASAFL